VEKEFSKGDRIQFTAPSKGLKVANRELGTVKKIISGGDLEIRLDSGREVRFNVREHAHLDHGYAVTSHSSQGQTAERVLINVDTEKSEVFVNNRFAYVSVSRAGTTRRFTRMMAASSRTSSAARVRNLQRRRWNSSRRHRRLSQLPCEKSGLPKKSKEIVLEWDSHNT
jgi:ATP-dependent exoDNAse (exonuclease V) alpha subunit